MTSWSLCWRDMDLTEHSGNNEWAVWSHSRNCGQCWKSSWRPVTCGVPQGWYWDRALCNISAGSIDSRTEHILLLILSTETKYVPSTYFRKVIGYLYLASYPGKSSWTVKNSQESSIHEKLPLHVNCRKKNPIKMQKVMEIKFLPLFALY